jgi:hypothetical protein
MPRYDQQAEDSSVDSSANNRNNNNNSSNKYNDSANSNSNSNSSGDGNSRPKIPVRRYSSRKPSYEVQQMLQQAQATSQMLSQQKILASQQQQSSKRLSTSAAMKATAPPPPRRWIYDRIDGTVLDNHIVEETNGTERGYAKKPSSFLCYPPPIIKCCPALLETNCVCVVVGRCGCCGGNDVTDRSAGKERTVTFSLGVVLNICGLALTIYAALALSTSNARIVQITNFAFADLQPTVIDPTLMQALTAQQQSTVYPTVTLELGLQALSIFDAKTNQLDLIEYNEFCDTPGMEQFQPRENCNDCDDATLYVTIGMLVAIVAYVPTLVSDCSRLYSHYDVNCQKFSSGMWSLVSLAGYGLVYYYFDYFCLSSFRQGSVFYNADGTVVEDGDAGIVEVNYGWKVGAGQICFRAGFVLKAVDLLCNCIVATPTITRDRHEQLEYERRSEQAELDEDVPSSPARGKQKESSIEEEGSVSSDGS